MITLNDIRVPISSNNTSIKISSLTRYDCTHRYGIKESRLWKSFRFVGSSTRFVKRVRYLDNDLCKNKYLRPRGSRCSTPL